APSRVDARGPGPHNHGHHGKDERHLALVWGFPEPGVAARLASTKRNRHEAPGEHPGLCRPGHLRGGETKPSMELPTRPSKEAFQALAADWPLVPVWTELLADASTPVGIFYAMAGEGMGILLVC